MEKQFIDVYKRKELYEKVWDKPLGKVGEEYGVSSRTIRTVCEKMDIPVPGRKYRALSPDKRKRYVKKLRANKTIPQELPVNRVFHYIPKKEILSEKRKLDIKRCERLEFLTDEEYKSVMQVSEKLPSYINRHACLKTSLIKQNAKIWNQVHGTNEITSTSYKDYISRNWRNKIPPLGGVMSDKSIHKVCKLLNALFYGMDQLGYSYDENLNITIRGQHFKSVIYEMKSKQPHKMAKQEQKEFESRKAAGKYTNHFRKYDYMFNGSLHLYVADREFILNGEVEEMAKSLPKILLRMISQAEIDRYSQLREEKRQNRIQAEKRELENRKNRYNEEVDKFNALVEEAKDHDIAMKIRAYVQDAMTDDSNGKSKEWCEWAMSKADWYDPLVLKKDEILGNKENPGMPEHIR